MIRDCCLLTQDLHQELAGIFDICPICGSLPVKYTFSFKLNTINMLFLYPETEQRYKRRKLFSLLKDLPDHRAKLQPAITKKQAGNIRVKNVFKVM